MVPTPTSSPPQVAVEPPSATEQAIDTEGPTAPLVEPGISPGMDEQNEQEVRKPAKRLPFWRKLLN